MRQRYWLMGLGGVLLIVPLAAGGFFLQVDSVAVPNQPLLPWMWGAGSAPPRSVPQDAIVAVVDNAVPGWILQRTLIVASLVLLGTGVAHLLRQRPRLDRACAAVVAVWSTYVFERMAMGHWGLLLGVAVLPWVMAAAADARAGVPGAAARAVAWAALGSLVPSAGALQLAGVVAVLAWPGPRTARPSAGVLVGVLALQSVWILPGVLQPGAPSELAAEVFGLRAEGWSGAFLTAVTTGGIWNAAAVPPSRQTWMPILAALVLLAAAVAGASSVRRLRATIVGPLVVLAGLGFGWALLTAIPAFADLVLRIESIPGGGLLRDAQKWLAPWLILLALSAGSGLARLARRLAGSDARGPAIALVVLVPILLLPDLAFGMWGRMQAVRYPAGWEEVRTHLDASADPGDVVSWPWSTFRAYGWNARRTSLDPAPRYLPRTVVTDSRLLVQQADQLVIVPSDDPRSTAVGESLLADDAAERLARLGVGWILVQRGQPASPGFPTALPAGLESASTPVVRAGELELRRLSTAPADQGPPGRLPVVGAWVAWALALIAAVYGVLRRRFPSWLVRPRLRRSPSATLPGTERR